MRRIDRYTFLKDEKEGKILKPFPRKTTKSDISLSFQQIANYSDGPINTYEIDFKIQVAPAARIGNLYLDRSTGKENFVTFAHV